MTDRDKDLSRIKLLGSQQMSGRSVAMSLACTGITAAAAFVPSLHDGSSLIFVVMLMAFNSMFFFVIPYFVTGPLGREVERLRAELELLKQRDVEV
ncbi:MAG: hypothetical protein GC162_19160 [Planctomycetes bacterium]|nr:hypothetical protein [Planctomycetota bacterium]